MAVWSGEALYVTTGADEQRAVNLRVILMTGHSNWDAGLDVVVEDDAVAVTDDALLTFLAAAWTVKWGRTMAVPGP